MTLAIDDTAPDFEAQTTVIIAGSVTDEDAKKQYPQGWKAPKPYIRIVPQPKCNSATPLPGLRGEGQNIFPSIAAPLLGA